MNKTIVNWVLGGVLVVGFALIGYYYLNKKSLAKGDIYDGDRPTYIGHAPSKYPCTLIAKDRCVYATHVWPRDGGYGEFSFGRALVKQIDDERVKMFSNGTDTSLALLETPVDIVPIKIADSVKEGDQVYVFTKDEAMVSEVERVWPQGAIKIYWGATFGDSSGVVVNQNFELVGLVTNFGGWCTNLTLIKDTLQE